MHRVFVYSIQHTGTFMAIETIASGFVPGKHISRFGSLYQRHIDLGHERIVKDGPPDISDWCPTKGGAVTRKWFDKYILSLAYAKIAPPKEEDKKAVDWSQVEIFVAHDHHHKEGSQLIQSLRNFKPEIPIVVPVRDPLLSLHSKNWRAIEIHKNSVSATEKQRIKRVESWVARYKEFLSLPSGHVFIFPIDGEQVKTEEGRLGLASDLHNFIGISFNQQAQEFAKTWNVANSTQALVKRRTGNNSDSWVEFKDKYAAGDIGYIKKYMNLEFEYLHKDSHLQRLLREAGYKELLWW